jgi:hypothetical protein
VRAYRLGKGVLLSEGARQAKPPLTLVRASEIERFPEKARPGELERLLSGVDRAAGVRRLESVTMTEFPGADPESIGLHLAAEQEITSAWTGRGEKIDYATAVRRASEKSHPPDVDQESQELDRGAQAEIESAWRNRGERIGYLQAVRRATAKKGNR